MSNHSDEIPLVDASDAHDPESRQFVEPRLTFLKPELEKQGSLENLTKQGFFGLFPIPGS